MHDRNDTKSFECVTEFGDILYITDNEWSPSHELPMASREIVVANWLVPGFGEGLAAMRSDVTGATGYQNTLLPAGLHDFLPFDVRLSVSVGVLISLAAGSSSQDILLDDNRLTTTLRLDEEVRRLELARVRRRLGLPVQRRCGTSPSSED